MRRRRHPGRDDPAFPAPEGGLLREGNFRRRRFDHAVAELDLGNLTPHDLRHAAASLAISAGANPKAVQRMLGHASAAMTLDVYAALFPDDLDAVVDQLDAAAPSRCARGAPPGFATPGRT
jgi:integrase